MCKHHVALDKRAAQEILSCESGADAQFGSAVGWLASKVGIWSEIRPDSTINHHTVSACLIDDQTESIAIRAALQPIFI